MKSIRLTFAVAALVALAAFIPLRGAPAVEAGSELHRFIGGGRLADLRWPNFSGDRSSITRFYEAADFEPAWVRSGEPTPQALMNPKLFHIDFDVERRGGDLAGWIRSQLISASNASAAVPAALSSIEPPFDGYRRSKHALAAYRKLLSEGETVPFPNARKFIKPGDSYPDLTSLAMLLRRLGDLQDKSTASDTTYSGAVVEAVKHFQARHGLDSDGVLGPATVRALNIPLSQRVRQIELTLERWRWLPHGFARPPIIVSIWHYEWRWVQMLRASLAAFVISQIATVGIDAVFFPQALSLAIVGLIYPTAFLLYLLFSTRVVSVFRKHNWEIHDVGPGAG